MQAEPSTAAGDEALRAAHARLLTDKSLQFQLETPKPPEPPPEWAKWLAEVLGFLAPALQWVFWGAVVLVVGAILFYVAREILQRRRPDRVKRAEAPAAGPVR